MPNDQLYWLAAVHTTISPQRFLTWLQHFKTMQAIFAAPVEFWRAEGLPSHEIKALSEPDWKRIDMSLEWSTRGNTHLVTLDDHDYPALLKEISDPPLVLFVQGSRSILSAQQIGMVGARAISPYGEKNADYFATKLSQAGYVITSGLARGIDAASHRAALQMSGLTIAVAGTGLFHTYPDNHRLLAAEIVDKGGALVSEFPLDTYRNEILHELPFAVGQLRGGQVVVAVKSTTV